MNVKVVDSIICCAIVCRFMDTSVTQLYHSQQLITNRNHNQILRILYLYTKKGEKNNRAGALMEIVYIREITSTSTFITPIIILYIYGEVSLEVKNILNIFKGTNLERLSMQILSI